MPKTSILTTNFSAGELSPKVEGRIDLAQYYKGARKAQNTIIAAQGGAYKRFGMGYKASLNLSGQGSLYNTSCANFKLIPFVTSQNEEMLVVLSNTGSIYIYNTSGLLMHTVEDTPFKGSYIENVSYATKDSFLLIVHPEVHPKQLTRNSSLEDGFTFEDVDFTTIPTYEWSNTLVEAQATQRYTLSFNNLTEGDIFQLEYDKSVIETVYNYMINPEDMSAWVPRNRYSGQGTWVTPIIRTNVGAEIGQDSSFDTVAAGSAVTNNYTGIEQSLELEVGQTYTYSFYIQGEGASGFNSAIEYDDGSILGNKEVSPINSLQRISNTFVHKGGNCSLVFTSRGGEAYLGKVMVTKGSTLYPYTNPEEATLTLFVNSFTYQKDDYQTGTSKSEAMISDLSDVFNDVGYDVTGTYSTVTRGGITESNLSYITFTPNSNLTPEVTLREVGDSNRTGGSVYLEKYYEEEVSTPETKPVWSESRGYPATVVFHKGRLWFGGSKSLPQTIWASKSYEYFNFSIDDESAIVDNDYIDRTIDSTVASTITSMYSSTRLIITTSSTPFTISSSTGVPTPNDLDITQEDGGAGELAPMVRMDNSVFYLQDGGSELNNIGYDYTSETYATYPNALLSNHLINNPKELCVTTGSGEFNAETLFLRNEDGTVATYKRLQAQEVANWTSFNTQGFINSLASIKSEAWFIVERDGLVGSVFTLESMPDKEEYLDCNSVFEGYGQLSNLSGLEVYAGQTVDLLCDGWWAQADVTDEGDLTLPFECNKVVIGYPINFELETMPVNVDTQQGSIKFNKKRINRTQIDIQDSFGFDITYLNRTKTVGDYTMGFYFDAPEAQTRLVDERWLGWTKEDATIKITSDKPYPVNVRSLELEVKFS